MPYCICTLIMFARTFNIKLLAISDNDLVIIINQHSRLKDWFRIKDRTTKLMKHNVAYRWFINWSDHVERCLEVLAGEHNNHRESSPQLANSVQKVQHMP